MTSVVAKYLVERAGVQDASGDKHLSYLVRSLNQQVEGFQQMGPGFGQVIDDSLLRTRKSDTVFIMGSGPSINSLSSAQFEEIGLNDSIGFNFWPAHEVVPTHYVLQLPRAGAYRESLIELLMLRQDDYGTSEVMVRGDHTFRDDAFHQMGPRLIQNRKLWYLPELAIHSQVQIDPKDLIEFFWFLGFLEHGTVSRAVPKWRGTLGLILSLAYQMGYTNIVLCGIDMNDSSHFYDDPLYRDRFPGLSLPEPGASNIDTFESVGYSKNTVSRYVAEFARFAYERSGTQLFLASPGSRLEGIIPDWQFGGTGS